MAIKPKATPLLRVVDAVMAACPHPTLITKQSGMFVLEDTLPYNMVLKAQISLSEIQLSARWQLGSPATRLLQRQINKQDEAAQVDRYKIDNVQYDSRQKTVNVYRTVLLQKNVDLLQVSLSTASFIESAAIVRGVLDWNE